MMLFITIMAGILTFYIIVKSITQTCIENDSFIMINARNTDEIECTVRKAIYEHPKSDIYIMNRCPDPQMSQILKLLKNDYPNLYIIDC